MFFTQKLVGDVVFGGRPVTQEHAISVYDAHIQEVQTTVPENRLLIYNLGDGWGPLCRHLEVAIPPQDYPYLREQGVVVHAYLVSLAHSEPGESGGTAL